MEIQEVRDSRLRTLKQKMEERNQYLKNHPKAKVQTALGALSVMAGKLKIKDWIKIEASEQNLKAQIDSEALKEAQKLDGCYVLKTWKQLWNHSRVSSLIFRKIQTKSSDT